MVVVSDDTQSEATDRLSLNLPSAQDELISAVAAANPHTVVVINAGAPVAMPWLPAVAGVLDTWYPGQTSGTSLASVLFGQTDPGGHLPVTFPASLSQVPASTTAQFPGNGSTVQYSEGIDVGYRWYDAKGITPLFPFGFGLSYTRFAFSHLSVSRPATDGTQEVRVSAMVTNIGHRAGSDVAQLYLADPAGHRRAAAPAGGVPAGQPGARRLGTGLVHGDPAGDVLVGRHGQRLDPDRRAVPGVRRRLLGAGRTAAAGLVHHASHAPGPAR